jgi:glutamyl-tRNA synthetase
MGESIKMEEIRVRFAPSPTGYLHIGGARTALFNYLFARNKKGKFILRIEDTDFSRSEEEFVKIIIEELKWLGLEWDEGPDIGGEYGPYFQSQRLNFYREYAEKLLKEGKAYYCYCTPEELEKFRKEAVSKGISFKYPKRCRNLTEEEIEKLEKEGRKKTIRFKVETDGEIIFKDIIRGNIKFKLEDIDDFIILKSDGSPVYNFAAVVDDALMKINYIIRGDDHISNTPKQILLYQALGFPVPNFAHVPLILGPDKTPLSKRHGATSLTHYREEGYLKEAIFNYLARLGWAYDDKQEIFKKEELIEKFSLEGISKSPAVFDINKLNWLNSYYIRCKNSSELKDLVIPFWRKSGLLTEEELDDSKLLKILDLVKERIKSLKDIEMVDFFFKEIEIKKEDREKFLSDENTKKVLKKVRDLIEKLENFDKENLEIILRNLSEELKIKLKEIAQILRLVITGKRISPPLFETMEILGKEKVIKRINKFLEMEGENVKAN